MIGWKNVVYHYHPITDPRKRGLNKDRKKMEDTINTVHLIDIPHFITHKCRLLFLLKYIYSVYKQKMITH